MALQVVLLGRINYSEALSIQEKLLHQRQLGLVEDTLLLVEHPPVLTLGRNGDYSNILLSTDELKSLGISLHEVSRGGDITYHGPGQIVGYPIIDLSNYGKDIRQFVWNLEETFIQLLSSEYNIISYRETEKNRGVWVNNNKITAIGIAVKRWVTMHGFAFNVNTQLENYSWINPCGITDRGVTSLQKLLGFPLDMMDLNLQVIDYYCRTFRQDFVITDIDTLLK